MNVARAEHGGSHSHGAWSTSESAVLDEAVHRAPSVHNTRLWSLAIHGRTAVLRERSVLLAQHDPRGLLEATSRGLAASVTTQPPHLEEVRTGLADRLGLTAVPQVLMRFGYPMGVGDT